MRNHVVALSLVDGSRDTWPQRLARRVATESSATHMPPELHQFAETYLIPLQLALAMLGMGATMSVRDFASVARQPLGLAIGLALQLVAVPLIALAFTEIFSMEPGWAVGLLLVSVVPGGAFSNLLTFLGRGNSALSISMTVVATAGCIVTIPFALSIIATSHLPADFVFPAERIVVEIFAYLLIPLVAGMALFRMRESVSLSVSRWAIRGSLLLIVLITISALGTGRIDIPAYGAMPPLLIAAFGLSLATVIPIVCRLTGRYDEDTLALGIEVTVRNVGVALLLVRFFFPGQPENDHVLYTCLFYAGLSGWLAIPMVLLHRRGKSPVVLLRSKRRSPQQA